MSCTIFSSTFELRKSFFGVFFARAPSGSVPDRFWRLRGLSRTRFFNDFARFFCRFRRDLVVVCRVPPECCRDTPPASGTHSAGFLWGTAISRSELNKFELFAHPAVAKAILQAAGHPVTLLVSQYLGWFFTAAVSASFSSAFLFVSCTYLQEKEDLTVV